MRVPERYRKRLYDVMLGDVEALPEHSLARELLESIAVRELEAILPIIEEMLDEFTRG